MVTDAATISVDGLVDELIERFRDLGLARLTAVLDRAVADLAGSVRDEALAEMAVRLAIFRLETSPVRTTTFGAKVGAAYRVRGAVA